MNPRMLRYLAIAFLLVCNALQAVDEQHVYGSYKFLEDVLLISERGTNIKRCRRFVDSPSVSLMWWQPHKVEFDAAVETINGALASTSFSLRPMTSENADAQIKCFHPRNHSDFVGITQAFWLQTSDHFTWDMNWDAWSRVTRSYAIVTTENLTPDQIRYQTLRAILGAMGLNGWSSEVRDSIFSGQRNTLSATDRYLIKFFYTRVQPHAQAYELRNAFDQSWNK